MAAGSRARGVRAEHSPVTGRTAVGPHRGEVAFGKGRASTAAGVTVDEAVPHTSGGQLGMDLVAHAGLADLRSAAEKQSLASSRHPSALASVMATASGVTSVVALSDRRRTVVAASSRSP